MAKLSEYKRKRDFSKTAEPAGGDAGPTSHSKLRFVIQKHAASHLHYDFRLELDGVMKSWAVPKGPSVDPSVKRLAMEVEDHPIEYNTFEGTIPQGQYGGGTVMLWDRGTYTADEAERGVDVEKVLKREYRAGKMSITLYGERLEGSWALVRTDPGPKPKWLLIKHRDEHARRYEATEEFVTSVVTDRTMEEIAGGARVWQSNRGPGSGPKSRKPKKPTPAADSVPSISPMRLQSAKRLPTDEARVFLPWRGGVRVLAYATADACALVREDGRTITAEYADIAEALASLARRAKRSFVLDSEIRAEDGAATMFVLDILFTDGTAVAGQPWEARRDVLEALFRRRRVPHVVVTPVLHDAEDLAARASDAGWEGILAIDPDSVYTPGKRSRDWLAVTLP